MDGAAAASDSPLLEMRNISKTFAGVRALAGVSLTVRAGEVHALMGENGAGKSTLMKILSGATVADPGGAILVDGRPVPGGDPHASKAAGISVIYQELSLAPNLTVAENIFLGAEENRFGFIDRGAARRRAAPFLDRLGAGIRPEQRVASLSLGERQLVEIARTLTTNARIIVMDEPTTSLTARETERLFEIIAGFKAHGLGIVYISHRMEEVYALADTVSVLRDGALVGTLGRAELSASRLVSMMVGRDLSSFYRKEHAAAAAAARPVVMRVRGIGDGVRVQNCSFDLHAGEVLGIAGLVGSGRTELARLIYGLDPRTAGTVELDGKALDLRSPKQALDAGIAYLTEDRKALGLFLDMSVGDNLNIGVIAADARAGLLDFAKGRARGDAAVKALSIRTAGTAVDVKTLSGGNQQKVLLARLLETEPRVIILDEPTRGVDVGAKSEIYRIIDALAKRGLGIVVISSDLPELVGIADRALVMRGGRIVGAVAASRDAPLDPEEIMTLATGSLPAAPEQGPL